MTLNKELLIQTGVAKAHSHIKETDVIYCFSANGNSNFQKNPMNLDIKICLKTNSSAKQNQHLV